MKYKLSEIGKVVGGGTPSTKHPEYYTGSGIPWLTPKDLSGYDKMYISKGGRDITQEGLENSSAKLLPANSVLVSSRAPIGYVAIAENEIATNQGFKSIIPNRELVIPEYLYFVMKTSKQDLEQIASGSTFKEVSTKVMSNFEVEIPDLDEQRKVLDYLLPITRKIEKNSRINDNLLELITLIWSRYSQNISNKVPLKKIAKDIVTGKTPSTKIKANYGSDIPFVKIPDMHNKVFIDETLQSLSLLGADSQKNKYLPANSIMVSCIGTPGLVSLTGSIAQTNQQINSLVLDKKFIYWVFLELRSLSNKIGNLGSGGTTIKNLNKSDFSKLEVVVPDNDILLDKFNSIAKPIFESIHTNSFETNKLNQLKKRLLHKFF